MLQYLTKIDTLLMGRKTFETTTSTQQGRDMFQEGGMFCGMEVFVVSTTIRKDNNDLPDYATLISPNHKTDGSLEKYITNLKHQINKKDIWLFGGGELFRALLQMGLLDTVEVAVAPVMLGCGIPLLKPDGLDGKVVKLHLQSSEQFDQSRMVLLKYHTNDIKKT